MMKIRSVLKHRSTVESNNESVQNVSRSGQHASISTKHRKNNRLMIANIRVDALAAALICFLWSISLSMAVGEARALCASDTVTENHVIASLFDPTLTKNEDSIVDDCKAEIDNIESIENEGESVEKIDESSKEKLIEQYSANSEVERNENERRMLLASYRGALNARKNTVEINIETMQLADWRIEVVREALRHIGNLEYIWGGEDLIDGSDCSGYVYAVYSACGLNEYFGERVSCDDMMLKAYEGWFRVLEPYEGALPGDIIVYYNNQRDGRVFEHCGIYVGSGKIAHMNGKNIGCDISDVKFRTTRCEYEMIRVLVPDDIELIFDPDIEIMYSMEETEESDDASDTETEESDDASDTESEADESIDDSIEDCQEDVQMGDNTPAENSDELMEEDSSTEYDIGFTVGNIEEYEEEEQRDDITPAENSDEHKTDVDGAEEDSELNTEGPEEQTDMIEAEEVTPEETGVL